MFFEVATLDNPEAEPFAVIRIDLKNPVGGGFESVVKSLHWTRIAAQVAADAMLADWRGELPL